MNAVATLLPVAQIPRSTVAAWMLYLDWSATVRESNPRHLDAVACSRTAIAEIFRHPDDGAWLFGVRERRPVIADLYDADAYAHYLVGPGDEIDYPTWRECFDAAHAAVRELRGVA